MVTQPYPVAPASAPVVYVQAAPDRSERMSVGGVIAVLFFAGIPGAIFAARHHSVWGSIWRGWLTTGVIVAVLGVIGMVMGA